ncbi:hypothetical protein [Pontibacter beigongshangensis]|uniref:hypothetical protein n=1 Tax=Pontibacter beigongshangensis TaxID=2574733 RepID=UPI0016500E5D|nr:hypothetical protein [Pontibacter beigongshangensis]
MKKIYLLIIGLCAIHFTHAQIKIEYVEEGKLIGINGKYPSASDYPEFLLPDFNFSKLKESSLKSTPEIPFQFGKSFDVDISLKDGKWYEAEHGKIWKMKIKSEGAFSINLIFSKLRLSSGAKLFIYNETRNMVMGPIDYINSRGMQV